MRRKSITRRKPPKRSIETLIEEMASSDDSIRKKAVKEFAGRLTLRNRAERRPDWLDPLTRLFRNSPHADVRSLCVQMITQSAPDGDTPAIILEAFDDVDPWVVVAGIWAQHYFAIDAAFDSLCSFAASASNVLARESAISALGELGDARAISLLAGVLRDPALSFDQTYGTAAMAMAKCGTAALTFLADALGDGDARIRRAAVVGIDVLDDPSTLALLRPMLDDVDVHVRERAGHAVRMRTSQ